MPVIDGLDPQLQWLLTTAFLISVGVFTAWSHVRGRAAVKPKRAEFSVAGQLADMGPVKELVEQTGLLVQQQVRTNMHLEAHTEKQGTTAEALHALAVQVGRLATAYEGQIAAERNEADIETEVQRRFERELERERRARRRVAPQRKSTQSS